MTQILDEGYIGILIFVNIHLACIVLGQVGYMLWCRHQRRQLERRRRVQGLSSQVLVHFNRQLADRRREVIIESCLLFFTIFIVPLILSIEAQFLDLSKLTRSSPVPAVTSAPQTATTRNTDAATAPGLTNNKAEANTKVRRGIAIAFLGMLLWILISGTSSAQAVLGGLTFKWLSVFTRPFDIGDRVTLKGHSGKVIDIGTFFVTLQTLDDNQISIPTYTLWGEQLNSSNAGNRSSLCVMDFYLASFVTKKQRQAAEDAIWDAIQASAYYDPGAPCQIYLTQTPEAIQLTAKAYVASTYNEPLFSSDVTRAFLDFTADAGIILASPSWQLENLPPRFSQS